MHQNDKHNLLKICSETLKQESHFSLAADIFWNLILDILKSNTNLQYLPILLAYSGQVFKFIKPTYKAVEYNIDEKSPNG